MDYRRRLFDLINERQVFVDTNLDTTATLNNLLFAVATCTKNKLNYNDTFTMQSMDAKDAFKIIHLEE